VAAFTVNRAKHATLGVSTVDTVTFPSFGTFPYINLYLTNRDPTTPIFFTMDGSTPTVNGDDCYCCAPGQVMMVGFSQGGAVKLISGAAAAYSIQAR
jgi:hypothetical protein